MNHYLFFLGQNHQLAQAELTSIFPSLEFSSLKDGILLGISSLELTASDFCRLGGTVKVAQLIAADLKELKPQLLTNLAANPAKNVSLTLLYSDSPKPVLEALKEQLNIRFLLSQTQAGLSPVAIQKKKVAEYFATSDSLYKTIWSHNFRHWISRDRNKPYVAPKIGMLPPKLARIMVNLGLGSQTTATLLDPFCGTGTILMEASLLGIDVIGSDYEKDQIAGAQKNLDWLPEEHFCVKGGSKKLLVADATHLSTVLDQKIDLIVTEPFLGKVNPKPTEVANIRRGLLKLYTGAFKDWSKFLKPGAIVVFAYPIFTALRSPKQAQEFIDTCENLGYNCLNSKLDFTRPNADLTRKILIFKKN